MRFTGLLLLVCALCAFSQSAGDPEVERAKVLLDKMRALEQAGAVPRVQVAKAEEALADAQDAAEIRAQIYSQDLTEEQANELVAAACRRFERRKQAFDNAKKLVDAGAEASGILTNLLQDMDFARKECDLADTRAKLAKQMTEMAKAEEALQAKLAERPAEAPQIAERFDGDGAFTPKVFEKVETAFESRFGKPLPISANGETAVHRALGFDHRGRIDVAIHPDQPEGVWLREYLTQNNIPFFAFRQAVPGKATGAHIHLGPMSTHLTPGG